MTRSIRCIIGALLIALALPAVALAQEVPAEIHGEVVYIPFPVDITVDGDLSDWEGLEVITVDYGPAPSKRPGENDSFSFSVATDGDLIFITMSMVEENIITGQHGSEWWNEDSLEFYFNFSGDLDAPGYTSSIHQVRMVPYNIGNEDPEDFVLDGGFAGALEPKAIFFETEDGWAFEASVIVPEGISVEHGNAVGFNAQANGAALSNRDVKLIWSIRDEDDDSWQTPSVFGSAVFFELGSLDVPPPPERGSTDVKYELPDPRLGVNQLGYQVTDPKTAAFVHDSDAPLPWVMRDANGAEVAAGETLVWGNDRTAGGVVHRIDFTSFTTPGDGYTIEVAEEVTPTFSIRNGIYAGLAADAMAYFYRNRSGIELLPEYAGESWARPPGHMSDADIGCFEGIDDAGREWDGCDYRLDGSRGWYDAGDYGKYVVNGGISVWTLMNLHETFPAAFADGSMSIPEAGNGVPDVLDEARWEMEFLLGMQVPDGQPMAGMAHHKLHDRQWDPIPFLPPTEKINDPSSPADGAGRFVYPPSTNATLNLAATAAQCARVFDDFDADFADRCLVAAEKAYVAAGAFPNEFTGSVPGSGGGAYHDGGTLDEWYWAAAELYATTGNEAYRLDMVDNRHHNTVIEKGGAMSWGSTMMLGLITTSQSETDPEFAAAAEEALIENADRLVELASTQGFRPPHYEYVWGSNGDLLNNAIVLVLAHEATGRPIYEETAIGAVDFVLGMNPSGFSYVTGYGEDYPQHPHHRFWANQEEWPAAPAGVLAGGPNADANDVPANQAEVRSLPEARRYIDHIESYSTNEVTINWNAPLVWMATWMDGPGGEGAGSPSFHRAWVALVLALAMMGGAAYLVARESRTGHSGAGER